MQYGSTYKMIKMEVIKNLLTPIPSYEEQKKIEDFILNIDKNISNNQKYQNLLRESKKGLMQDLLTGIKRVKLENWSSIV